MVSLLDDMALIHHQDHIRSLDGGEPVGHHEAGAPLHQGFKGPLDTDLRHGIDGGGGLVQDQHRRQAQHDPGDTQ